MHAEARTKAPEVECNDFAARLEEPLPALALVLLADVDLHHQPFQTLQLYLAQIYSCRNSCSNRYLVRFRYLLFMYYTESILQNHERRRQKITMDGL